MTHDDPESPRVGVGCIVTDGNRLLMVRNHGRYWSTPGGNLEFGESPADCAARETFEETGVRVTNLRFVAVTNDIVNDTGRHYITIWMRGDALTSDARIGDAKEIAEIGWFPVNALPVPRFSYFENLFSGRCLPSPPLELGDIL